VSRARRPRRRETAAPRYRRVAAAVAAQRVRHPEQLSTHVTSADVLQVLAREGIACFAQPAVGGIFGRAFAFLGTAVVAYDAGLSEEATTAVLLHELGHVLLHVHDPADRAQRRLEGEAAGFDQARASWIPAREDYTPTMRRDELEADQFAILVMGRARYAAALATIGVQLMSEISPRVNTLRARAPRVIPFRRPQ
jgi:Zn-dependent protease with chaperone function